jgi:hypothetical protein
VHARAQILSLVVTATTRTAGARMYLLLFFVVWCGIETYINRYRIGDRSTNRGHARVTETAATIPDFRKLGLLMGLIAVVVAWARYRNWGKENNRLLLELLTEPVRAARSQAQNVHACAQNTNSIASLVPGQIDEAPALVTRGTSTEHAGGTLSRKIPAQHHGARGRGITLYAIPARVDKEKRRGRLLGDFTLRFHAGRDEMLN